MSSLKGYNTCGCKILNGSGSEVEPASLKRYQCVICEFILRAAQQIDCGDRLCKECLPSDPFTCLKCGDDIDPSKPNMFFNDRSCQKDILGFSIVCSCGETFKLEEWELHSETCEEFQKVKPKTAEAKLVPQEAVHHLEHQFKLMKVDVSDQKKQTGKFGKRLESLEKEVRQLRTMIDDVRRMGTSFGTSADGDTRAPMSDQLNGTVMQLVSDVEQQKGTVRQLNQSVEHITQTLPRVETLLEDLNLKIEILEVKSATGVYVWKINEIARRTREAKSGRTISLYSPPFYTSTHGYRICLRAYLNGDGSGKGTHVSMFIVIMKSEFDDLLVWPFQHRVSLTLINQDHPLDVDKCMNHRFVPNGNSSSFKKPVDAFNVASGFPEFAPLSVLTESAFCKSDTIYIRIKLDPPDCVTGPDDIVVM